ncbi:hypothetical protein [Nocardia brasiliensis]|uniref:PE domain-containing protein n=1 Tax=Nocardia brasiliensis (strain ATCC 700358 / HUJEG-1) TaxID=1133849 RepID=K0FCC0_NOCB7|nr:hypothetical protein [Nocardia brasiliensis]AFU05206.1 hypothetical protein O3I_036295 [Nocardia brasiliensis ATCC 700358]OCF88063.1 hypothetical protein AW168_23845 [Nocardia brasiliensis]
MVDSPFPGYIEDAKSGALQVRMDPQGFVEMDKACQELISQLTGLRGDARELSEKAAWGLGEANPRLSSAVELVQLFREKAFGGPNNAYDTVNDYITVAEDIRSMFQAMCETYARTDADFAAKLRELRV